MRQWITNGAVTNILKYYLLSRYTHLNTFTIAYTIKKRKIKGEIFRSAKTLRLVGPRATFDIYM